MKDEDVKIGMKVVPHSKSVYGSHLFESTIWREAQSINQPYLYVVKVSGSWLLDVKDFYRCGGDYFLASDFEPYKEENKMEERNLKLSLEKARELFGKDKIMDELILQTYTKEELEENDLSWKSVRKQYCVIDNTVASLINFLNPVQYNVEKNRIKFQLIANIANGEWEYKKGVYGWYVHTNILDEICFSKTNYNYNFFMFKSRELIEKAYKANKEIVEEMLK